MPGHHLKKRVEKISVIPLYNTLIVIIKTDTNFYPQLGGLDLLNVQERVEFSLLKSYMSFFSAIWPLVPSRNRLRIFRSCYPIPKN